MVRKITRILLAGALACAAQLALAQSEFVIDDIQVEGLERISPGTVFTYLPVSIGDTLEPRDSGRIIRALFETGFFSDVALGRRADILVIRVEERPAIAEVNVEGNRRIRDQDLDTALEDIGLVRGRVYNDSLLETLELELERLYFSQGKYAVRLESTVTELPRNRVRVELDITEGKAATIQRVNVVGNQRFSDRELTGDFELGRGSLLNPLNWFGGRQYSQQALTGDLETLESYYLDRGHIRFNIDSTQVSISPDKQDIFVTINVTEGAQYTFKDVTLEGDLVLPEERLRALIPIEEGDVFSRRVITDSTSLINRILGLRGYAFSDIDVVPQVDEARREVSLRYVVDPGRRVYVRRIRFSGNVGTEEEVLRREMRQLEGDLYSGAKIDRSRLRLQRLPYISNVSVDTPRVPGSDEEIDVEVEVTERSSGQFQFGVGFSQTFGFLFNLSFSQSNFLGTGRTLGVDFQNSSAQTSYRLNYTNPYYTLDGISRSFELFYRESDLEETNLSNFFVNALGAGVTYGIPLSEFNRLSVGGRFESTEIVLADAASDIIEFVEENGDEYDLYVLSLGFVRDTRNRAIFPERGMRQSLGAEVATPIGDLAYYKLSYESRYFLELFEPVVFAARAGAAYGAGIGDTDELPFFERFFGGGPRSLRGFEENSLGPRDEFTDDPVGGDFRVLTGFEVRVPPPGIENADNIRLVGFVDAGNVFGDVGEFDVDELRASVGAGVIWISPIGGLTFSLSAPLNSKAGDETQGFQFSIGTGF